MCGRIGSKNCVPPMTNSQSKMSSSKRFNVWTSVADPDFVAVRFSFVEEVANVKKKSKVDFSVSKSGRVLLVGPDPSRPEKDAKPLADLCGRLADCEVFQSVKEKTMTVMENDGVKLLVIRREDKEVPELNGVPLKKRDQMFQCYSLVFA